MTFLDQGEKIKLVFLFLKPIFKAEKTVFVFKFVKCIHFGDD